MFKKILGFLTDVLTAGRAQGWWEKKQSIDGVVNPPKEKITEDR